MKTLSVILVALCLCALPALAVPTSMDYQGYFEENGQPLSGQHTLVFVLYDAATGGTQLWTETQANVPFDRGLFAVKLGAVTPLSLALFQRPEVYIAVQIDGHGFATRTKLVSVPYAFLSALADEATHAVNADHATYADSSGITVPILTPPVRIEGGSPYPRYGLEVVGDGHGAVSFVGATGGTNHNLASYRFGTYSPEAGLNQYWSLTQDPDANGSFDFGIENYVQHGGTGRVLHIKHDTGYVSIGTTASEAPLTVYGGPTAPPNMMVLRNTATGGGPMAFAIGAEGTPIPPGIYGIGDENNLRLAINRTTGNVGIGTAAPATKLHLNGQLTIDSDVDGSTQVINTGSAHSEQNRYLVLINSPFYTTASGLKAGGVLVADDYSYGNPGKSDLIVKGNVGIGTANPTAKLMVVGDMCVTGQKNAIVPTSKGMTKVYCDESTALWFIDRGEGRTSHGVAHIELDPTYLETVTINGDHPMVVHVDLYGTDKVAEVTRGTAGFDVRVAGEDAIEFSWRVDAKRKGYENVRLEVLPTAGR